MDKKYLIIISLLFLLQSCNSAKESTITQPIAQDPVIVQPSPQVLSTLSPEHKNQKLVTEKPLTERTSTSTQTSATSQENTDKQKIQELSNKLDLITAKYTDLHEAAEQEYIQFVRENNERYINGEITPGQLDYQKDAGNIAKLEKQVKYQKALVQESQAVIDSTVDVKALYQKYNIPSNAGAATFKAIASQL
jgi:hypothetical protein